MSDHKHTPAPWKVDPDPPGCFYLESEVTGELVTVIHDYRGDGHCEPTARRIVACVNACEGINPEAVKDMLAALKKVQPFAIVRPLGTDRGPWEDAMGATERAIDKATN